MTVLPRPLVQQALGRMLPIPLVPTDLGYFPHAAGHYFERPIGCSELIVILCVRGEGWLEVHGRRYEVAPAQFAFLLPREPHRYGAEAERPWTIYWCHAAGCAAEHLGRTMGEQHPNRVVDTLEQSRLVDLFEEIAGELARGYGLGHLIAASMALAHLLGIAISDCNRRADPPDALVRVEEAICYMRLHRAEHISIPEVASRFNLSTSHFCALFKKLTGFSPLDYFIRMKIRRACELLDTTNWAATRVADELGFCDPFYFSRVFRRIQGVPPTEYRKTRKG